MVSVVIMIGRSRSRPACRDRRTPVEAGLAQVDHVRDQHDADVDDHADQHHEADHRHHRIVVPVSAMNQMEPTIAKKIEVMIDRGTAPTRTARPSPEDQHHGQQQVLAHDRDRPRRCPRIRGRTSRSSRAAAVVLHDRSTRCRASSIVVPSARSWPSPPRTSAGRGGGSRDRWVHLELGHRAEFGAVPSGSITGTPGPRPTVGPTRGTEAIFTSRSVVRNSGQPVAAHRAATVIAMSCVVSPAAPRGRGSR